MIVSTNGYYNSASVSRFSYTYSANRFDTGKRETAPERKTQERVLVDAKQKKKRKKELNPYR